MMKYVLLWATEVECKNFISVGHSFILRCLDGCVFITNLLYVFTLFTFTFMSLFMSFHIFPEITNWLFSSRVGMRGSK